MNTNDIPDDSVGFRSEDEAITYFEHASRDRIEAELRAAGVNVGAELRRFQRYVRRRRSMLHRYRVPAAAAAAVATVVTALLIAYGHKQRDIPHEQVRMTPAPVASAATTLPPPEGVALSTNGNDDVDNSATLVMTQTTGPKVHIRVGSPACEPRCEEDPGTRVSMTSDAHVAAEFAPSREWLTSLDWGRWTLIDNTSPTVSYQSKLVLEEAVKEMRDRNDAIGTWVALLALSQTEQALGDSSKAISNIEEALAVIDEAKGSTAPLKLDTLVAFASLSGSLPETSSLLEQNADILRPIIFQYVLEPVTHDLYGRLLTEIGLFEKAEAELSAAAGGAQLSQGMYDSSIAAHFGDLRFRQQRYDEARAHYQKALRGSLQTVMNASGDRKIEVRVYDRLAHLEALTGHLDKAMRWNDESLRIVRSAGWLSQESVALQTRGRLLMESERFADAEEAFKEALLIAERVKTTAQADVEPYLGSLRLWTGNHSSVASRIPIEACSVADENQGSDMRVRLLAMIGASSWKQGDVEQAIRSFAEAAAPLSMASGDVRSGSTLLPYLGDYHRAYYDVAVEVLLRNGKIEEAFETTERARARTFLGLLGRHRLDAPTGRGSVLVSEAEELRMKIASWDAVPLSGERLADLRERYEALLPRVQTTAPEYASLTTIQAFQLDSVRKELPENTTLLSYFATPFGVHAWILDRDTLEHVRLKLSAPQMRRVTCWANQLASAESTQQEEDNRCSGDQANATEAYAVLIEPLRSKIRSERLMIIPDGELRYVPFAALYDPARGRYLVEDYPITFLPSASTLRFLRGKESPVDGGTLVVGDPRSATPLPNSRGEAQKISELLHATAKVGPDAHESLLYGLDGKVDLLHIAAHATYDAANPLFSAIHLAEGDGKDGQLNVDEIQSEVDLTGVNLVVLSACQSRGSRSAGDEIVGLTRSILYAGSPGVVGTLWNLGDEATSQFVDRFYDHLLTGIPAADALRAAQVEMLRNPKFADPRFWATFFLTGNPRGVWKGSK